MRIKKILVAFLLTACVFSLSACQAKKTTPTISANLQAAAELPTVQLKPIKNDDPSTYPPENFITLKTNDGKEVGDGYRSYEQNTFVLKVAVSLPDLKSGEQYQSFLVNPSSKKFVPTGSLTQKQDKWIVNYTDLHDAKDFTHLIIASGKDLSDPDKGSSIASGDFRN